MAQLSLDLGEAARPVRKASAFDRHLTAGLCGWSPHHPWCTAPAVARPWVGAHDCWGVDADELSGPWAGCGTQMCLAHAGEVAESWWWDLWEIADRPGWYVDSSQNELFRPSVWVRLSTDDEGGLDDLLCPGVLP